MLCKYKEWENKMPQIYKIKKNVNDYDLVISSTRVVLEDNERGKQFYKTWRNIVERIYRRSFHLQYKKQSNDSKNHVISKLQEVFKELWALRPVRHVMEKTYSNKNELFKNCCC